MVSAWLLSLHLETVPVSPQLLERGDSPWERRRLGVWDLGKVGQAVPLVWVLTSSPGLCPLTDTSMLVTALGRQSQAFLVTGAVWCLKAGVAGVFRAVPCVVALMKMSALSKEW